MRALLLVAAILLTAEGCPPPEEPRKPAVRCEEDMPCWDCHTMGNKRCSKAELDRERRA